jgi:hypothetical protein
MTGSFYAAAKGEKIAQTGDFVAAAVSAIAALTPA